MSGVDAAALIRMERLRDPRVVALARQLSLAVRIEVELMRSMRLRMLPGADAGVEADLFFSTLVAARSAGAFALDADVRRLLREELARHHEELAAVRDVLVDAHGDMDAAILVEELATADSLRDDHASFHSMQRRLGSVVRSLESDGDPDLVDWADGALQRLPSRARESDAGRALRRVLERRRRGDTEVSADAPVPTPVSLAFSAHGDGVSLGTEATAGSIPFTVPGPLPVDVEVGWPTPGGWEVRRVTVPGDGTSADVADVPHGLVRLRTSDGGELRVRVDGPFADARPRLLAIGIGAAFAPDGAARERLKQFDFAVDVGGTPLLSDDDAATIEIEDLAWSVEDTWQVGPAPTEGEEVAADRPSMQACLLHFASSDDLSRFVDLEWDGELTAPGRLAGVIAAQVPFVIRVDDLYVQWSGTSASGFVRDALQRLSLRQLLARLSHALVQRNAPPEVGSVEVLRDALLRAERQAIADWMEREADAVAARSESPFVEDLPEFATEEVVSSRSEAASQLEAMANDYVPRIQRADERLASESPAGDARLNRGLRTLLETLNTVSWSFSIAADTIGLEDDGDLREAEAVLSEIGTLLLDAEALIDQYGSQGEPDIVERARLRRLTRETTGTLERALASDSPQIRLALSRTVRALQSMKQELRWLTDMPLVYANGTVDDARAVGDAAQSVISTLGPGELVLVDSGDEKAMQSTLVQSDLILLHVTGPLLRELSSDKRWLDMLSARVTGNDAFTLMLNQGAADDWNALPESLQGTTDVVQLDDVRKADSEAFRDELSALLTRPLTTMVERLHDPEAMLEQVSVSWGAGAV